MLCVDLEVELIFLAHDYLIKALKTGLVRQKFQNTDFQLEIRIIRTQKLNTEQFRFIRNGWQLCCPPTRHVK